MGKYYLNLSVHSSSFKFFALLFDGEIDETEYCEKLRNKTRSSVTLITKNEDFQNNDSSYLHIIEIKPTTANETEIISSTIIKLLYQEVLTLYRTVATSMSDVSLVGTIDTLMAYIKNSSTGIEDPLARSMFQNCTNSISKKRPSWEYIVIFIFPYNYYDLMAKDPSFLDLFDFVIRAKTRHYGGDARRYYDYYAVFGVDNEKIEILKEYVLMKIPRKEIMESKGEVLNTILSWFKRQNSVEIIDTYLKKTTVFRHDGKSSNNKEIEGEEPNR